MDVNLEQAGLVDGRVEEGKQALHLSVSFHVCATVEATHLVSNIRTSVADIPIHLSHHTNMLIAVEQRVFFFATVATAV